MEVMSNRSRRESDRSSASSGGARLPARTGHSSPPRGDLRFQQLLALAEAGDECAVADLFKEFDYVFAGGEEGTGHDAH